MAPITSDHPCLVDATNRVDAALVAIQGRSRLTVGEVTDLLLDLRSSLRETLALEDLLHLDARPEGPAGPVLTEERSERARV